MYNIDCEHHFFIPSIGTCCGYYSKTLDAYGRKFAHYPECEEKNCPIAHPELLHGRKLASEVESKSKMVGFINAKKREGKRCFFCNTTTSVKYVMEVTMPSKFVEPVRAYACNKCALVKVR